MIEETLPVVYHQQDTGDYCGAACVQMVLHQMGAILFPQEDLYAHNHNFPTADTIEWLSSPDGVTDTLNFYNPMPDRFFLLYNETIAEIISRKIVWTIHRWQVAPIALVLDRVHWVVVCGYMADPGAPNGSMDTSYAIGGFWIHNPFPPTPHTIPPGPPPPHTDTDTCGRGTGGPVDYSVYGHPNEFIGYQQWEFMYMTPVIDGIWRNQYLAVCDPEPPPKKTGKKTGLKRYFAGEKIISIPTAKELAQKALKDSGLDKAKSVEHLMQEMMPGNPVLVQCLHRDNDFYYIIPMMDSNENITAFVNIDARYGNFREASFQSQYPFKAIQPLATEEILNVLGSTVKLEKEKKILHIYKEGVSIYPTLVWRPCAESLSPYFPFHMITVQNYRIYIGIDKQIFTALNVDVRGT